MDLKQSSPLSQFNKVPVGTFPSFYFCPSAGLATLNIDMQDFLSFVLCYLVLNL